VSEPTATVVVDDDTVSAPLRPVTRPGRRWVMAAWIGLIPLGVAVPFLADSFWLQIGLFAMAATVAAFGMTLLLGQAGQLSLGHSFFVAVGAYGYTFLAATSGRTAGGAGLPPVVAALIAVLLAGAAGLIFSPVAARLGGVYLGIATLGLVFLGQHVLANAPRLTGGDNGRSVPTFVAGGLTFGSDPGGPQYLLNVLWGREQKLWYLFLLVTVAAYGYLRTVIRGRPGRALRAIRDRELMAGVVGVPVTRYKAYAFLISSMYAGLGGVLFAIAFRRIVPETFGVSLSIEYLAMTVIGGLGVAGGAVAGAVFVSGLPSILERYAGILPGLSPNAATSGISPAVAAKFIYGAAVVVLLVFEPAGLAGLARRIFRRPRFRRSDP
jgi:branched-chain amino acid transport system permease protein